LSSVRRLPFDRPSSLADQAAAAIRARIVTGELELGEALSETALAAELGVSKTPIREAFLRLKTEGLVDIKPQRGTFVFQMTADEVRELSELREVLEIAAARLAIGRQSANLADALDEIIGSMGDALDGDDILAYRTLDGAFHQRIIEHAGNAFLQASYEMIAFRVQALRNRLSRDPALNRRSLREHQELAQLVRAGNSEQMSKTLSSHIRATAADYVQAMEKVGA
jgi:DNA-binding GntR family transcriptional regulator